MPINSIELTLCASFLFGVIKFMQLYINHDFVCDACFRNVGNSFLSFWYLTRLEKDKSGITHILTRPIRRSGLKQSSMSDISLAIFIDEQKSGNFSATENMRQFLIISTLIYLLLYHFEHGGFPKAKP